MCNFFYKHLIGHNVKSEYLQCTNSVVIGTDHTISHAQLHFLDSKQSLSPEKCALTPALGFSSSFSYVVGEVQEELWQLTGIHSLWVPLFYS